ncbi:hypothetical protein DKX38_016871 [Salix brachista]|uniref:Uncharacterized protein n=1 Tax=Salix brachista TaxID=2182728 RepID=A0A5N5KTP9_9ROSI|nr:hypothetical protein DKX38_016871 [Salix brachista]
MHSDSVGLLHCKLAACEERAFCTKQAKLTIQISSVGVESVANEICTEAMTKLLNCLPFLITTAPSPSLSCCEDVGWKNKLEILVALDCCEEINAIVCRAFPCYVFATKITQSLLDKPGESTLNPKLGLSLDYKVKAVSCQARCKKT